MANSDIGSGVYAITNTVNGRKYIGMSINIERRWKDHRLALRGRYHNNRGLQADWNKYGEASFAFSVIEMVDIYHLIERENAHIAMNFAETGTYGYNQIGIMNTGDENQPFDEDEYTLAEIEKLRNIPANSLRGWVNHGLKHRLRAGIIFVNINDLDTFFSERVEVVVRYTLKPINPESG